MQGPATDGYDAHRNGAGGMSVIPASLPSPVLTELRRTGLAMDPAPVLERIYELNPEYLHRVKRGKRRVRQKLGESGESGESGKSGTSDWLRSGMAGHFRKRESARRVRMGRTITVFASCPALGR